MSIANHYKESLDCNILIFPHHGSAASLNRVFLGYANPEFTIISAEQTIPIISIRISDLFFKDNGYKM
jgi:hypothetical protein